MGKLKDTLCGDRYPTEGEQVMNIWPAVTVPTEVGMIKIEFIGDQYVIQHEPWNDTTTTIEWLDRGDIEAIADACRLLLKMTQGMGQ
jgi:hypothetical protein